MVNEIKFRAWDNEGAMQYFNLKDVASNYSCPEGYFIPNAFGRIDGMNVDIFEKDIILMQYTGLKDKENLKEIYEGDIIDKEGNIKGNIYEMDKKETDFIIQGLGTKTWCKTYNEAIHRGCQNAE